MLRYYFHELLEQANLTHDESRTTGDREGAVEIGTDWEGDESNVVGSRVQRCVHLSKLMHSCMRHTVFPKDHHHNTPTPHILQGTLGIRPLGGGVCVPSP